MPIGGAQSVTDRLPDHLLGEARLGTGRIHSLVNRWIPWCHSEPAAAPAILVKLEQRSVDKEEEATGYTEQLRTTVLINSTTTSYC